MRKLNINASLGKSRLLVFFIAAFALTFSACEQTTSEVVGTIETQSTSGVVEKIETQSDSLARKYDFSGVLLLAKGDKIIFEKAYGYANRDFDIPNNLETKFGLASMNKMFTALTILRLFEEKELSLDSKLIEILPNYPNQDVANRITIHQILTHTSGLGFYWEGLDANPRSKFDKLEDYVRLFVDQELAIEPGSQFSYSNAGYIVLGLIIEELTEQDYHEYIDRTIFTPLGMDDTSSPRNDSVTKNRAIGYTRSIEAPGQWVNNLYQSEFRGSSAGGGISTAHDLLKYADALENFELLNKMQTDIYTRPRVESHRGHYGYGIEVSDVNGHRIIGHSGGHVGIASELKIFTDLDYTFIIMSNGELEPFYSILNTVMEALTGPSDNTTLYHYTDSLINMITNKGLEATIVWHVDNATEHEFSSRQLERAAIRLLHQRKTETAVELLEFNVTFFPDSATNYYYLGDAYRMSGETDKAIAAYNTYLETYPEDTDAKRWTESLKE